MERWRDVVTHPGIYEVSDLGRVRSVTRTVHVHGDLLAYPRRLNGRVLRPGLVKTGYHQYTLWFEHQCRQAMGHVLVLEAFVGPRPTPAHYGCHKDDNPSNNALSNLYWGTPTENSADKIRHGNQPRGSRIPWAILDETKVREILLLSRTTSQVEIARRFGVCFQQVNRIVRGQQWRHVTLDNSDAVDARAYMHARGAA